MKITTWHFTHHAKGRSRLRQNSEEEVKTAILSYDRRTPCPWKGHHGGYCYQFEKDYSEYKTVVIADLYKEECYIVTTYQTDKNED